MRADGRADRGPDYFDADSIRSDIREGRPGTPLVLALRVRAGDDCAPVENAIVDIWHCDAGGVYSGFDSGEGERFLRGAQATNEDGIAKFTTIYPGFCQGRTVHIHAKVHLDRQTVLTTQLYFDDAVSDGVRAGSLRGQGERDQRNDSDGIFDDSLLLTLERSGKGYLGLMNFDVRARLKYRLEDGDGDPARRGAARRRGARSPASSSRTGGSCTPTATGCSARCTTPRTPSRTRSCGRGAGCARFDGRSSLRTWLYRIATNTSLDVIGKRPKRVLPLDHGPASDPFDGPGRAAAGDGLDRAVPGRAARPRGRLRRARRPLRGRESVELAFVAAVQHLPATQRAVLILREVLGFSAKEVAEALDTSVASVNSALQRARKTVEEKMPAESQQATLRALGDRKVEEIVEPLHAGAGERRRRRGRRHAGRGRRVVDAAARHLVPRRAVRRTSCAGPLSGAWRWRHLPAHVNGQAAVGVYAWDEARAPTCRSRSTC